MREVDVFIRQKAVGLRFTCSECFWENEVPITDADFHDICYGDYGTVACSECGVEYEIGEVEA